MYFDFFLRRQQWKTPDNIIVKFHNTLLPAARLPCPGWTYMSISQSANYRPPATAPSAPPAYPGGSAYPTAVGVPAQPQAPPPYPGAPQQQGGVYYNPDAKR